MQDWIAQRGLQVVDRERLRELSVKSNLRGWLQIGSHLGAIGVTTVAIAMTGFHLWSLPLYVVQGILLNCLYAGLHELSHFTVFKHKQRNDLFGQLFGFVTFNPFLADRWGHFTHHRFTQDPEKDPELMGVHPRTMTFYVFEFLGVAFWYRRFRIIVHTAFNRLDGDYWLSKSQRATVVREAHWYIAGYAVIAGLSVIFSTFAAIEFWLAPLLATKWFHQLQNLGEHVGMTHEPDTLINTRTLTGPAVMRWLMWNMSYHSAHHTFPGVPFFALPVLHAEIVANLDEPLPTASYLGAQREIFRALRRTRASEIAR